MAPNISEPTPTYMVSRKYFTGVEDVPVFLEELEEYFLLNRIADTDKYSILKCSLKADAKILFASVAFPSLGEIKRNAFCSCADKAVRDKAYDENYMENLCHFMTKSRYFYYVN